MFFIEEKWTNKGDKEEKEIFDTNKNYEKDKEKINIKCSSNNHSEINAIKYCIECKINMCNKCDKIHYELFKNHHQYNFNKDIKNIFTGFCTEKKHLRIKLEYFCKNHNILCCAACLCNINGNGNGLHKDCNACFIRDIKDEKKNNLNNNIKFLKNLSINLVQSINELKKIVEQIKKQKESLKLDIQKIFTKIRNNLNEREDELLLEVDNKYDELFFKEEIVNNIEKIPNKLKLLLEKGEIQEEEWNDDTKIKSLIKPLRNIVYFFNKLE